MKMQDEEFDELFSSKLNDLEVEPSERVWTGLTKATRHEERTKKVRLYLGIAASILAFLGIGAVFLAAPQKPPRLAVKVQNGINSGSPLAGVVDRSGQKYVTNVPAHRPVTQSGNASHFNTANLKKHFGDRDLNSAVKAESKTPGNVDDGEYAALRLLPAVKSPANVPSSSIPPLEATAIVALPEQDFKIQPAALTRETAPDASAKRPAKHRIRTLGDMFNIVIAKVDKRKDKVIEFGNTDDDESTITSVNLGILKIKKDE